MANRDYYEVLGIDKNATEADIKRAYRRMARKYHPDLNKEHPKEAEENFKKVNEAYHVLSDADKRAQYDQMGHSTRTIYSSYRMAAAWMPFQPTLERWSRGSAVPEEPLGFTMTSVPSDRSTTP